MKKIYVNEIEKISACTIVPIGIFVVFVPLFFISLIFNSKNLYLLSQWDGIFWILIYVSIGILILNFILYFISLGIRKDKMEYLQIEDDKVILKIKSTESKRSFENYEISFVDIISANYCICKWYAIPILYFYKQQSGGEFNIVTKDKIYSIRILFRDYRKIAKYLQIETK